VGGLKENTIRASVDTMSAHMLARPVDYPNEMLSHPVDALFEVDAKASAWLDANSEAWTERLLFTPEAIQGADGMRVRGIGFDPERDAAVFPRSGWKVKGAEPKTAGDGVLVARGPAELLGIEPGSWLTLRVRTPAGALNAMQVKVAGVFSSGSPMLDMTAVFLPQDLARELMNSGTQTSHVLVRLRDRDKAPGSKAAMAAALGGQAEIATWQEETADMMRLQNIRQRILDIIVFALLGMSATGIANTVLMAAYERIREIGTLRAMGMSRAAVVGLFVFEGALIGIVGGALGVALGGGLIWYGSVHGIDLTAVIEGSGDATSNIPMSAMLYTDFSVPTLVVGFLFGALVAKLASVYPALVASSMQPADAVRS
jgi:putative ABC transport system permease protein